MDSYNQALIEILKGVENWEGLKFKLEKFNTTQTETTKKKTTAGKIFEYFAKYYFLAETKVKSDYKKVWLYDDIPIDIRKKLNLPSVDHGIDLLLQSTNDDYHAVQCKFKNDELKKLSWSGDKIANVLASGTLCQKVIVFSNATDVTGVAKSFDKYSHFVYDALIDIKPEVFKNILLLALGQQPKEIKKYVPKAHQLKAINEVVKYLEKNDRGQLILPCGAGKTLTALWIKEELKYKTILVLVPSLALLKQIKNDWAEQRSTDYKYMCVCSEKDIDKDRPDSVIVHTFEISGLVSTDPIIVSNFINEEGSKVIFSTYQSLKVIQEACEENEKFSFDLIICDEAHRTTGSKNKNVFTLVHYNDKIPSKKRLYMTATPKVVSTSFKAKLGGDYELLCDMNNPSLYGEEAFRMTFGEAIEQGILVDYKIIGIGVTDKQIKEFIDRHNFLGDYSVTDLAHNFALELVMKKYNAFHALSFHSKVALAKGFSERHSEFFNEVYSKYVAGKQSTTYRARVLNEFKKSKRGIVSNARCLTEGVDVPTIDLIYFCDPKTSKIDIVQASGRALRISKINNKKMGYIVVPIFHHIEENLEAEIKRKPIFNHLIQVVRSLCDQDERLQAYIDKIAFEKGKNENSKIEIDFSDNEAERVIRLEGLENKLKNVLFDEIIEKTRTLWEVRFMQLLNFQKENNHLNVLKGDYPKLHNWMSELRRYNRGNKLDSKKKERLNEIGFDWKSETSREVTDIDEIWWSSFEKLVDYHKKHGNCDVPAKYSEDRPFGTWVVTQRRNLKINNISQDRIDLLNELNFKWKGRGGVFEKFIERLEEFKSKYGHTMVQTGSEDFPKLAKWTNRYRTILNNGVVKEDGSVKHSAGTLTKQQINKLFELGFKKSAGRLDWEGHYNELKTYFEQHGHSSPKQSDDLDLYHWCYRVREKQDDLTKNKKELLEKINFNFKSKKSLGKLGSKRKETKKNKKNTIVEPTINSINKKIDDLWMVNLYKLEDYYKSNNTFHIPNYKKDLMPLRSWLQYQKNIFKKNKLDNNKIKLLKSIGFSFDLNYRGNKFIDPVKSEVEWDEKFEDLKNFNIKYKTFLIPNNEIQFNSLKTWIQEQKRQYKLGNLSSEIINRLLEIGYSFDLDYRGKKFKYETNPDLKKEKNTAITSNSETWKNKYLKLIDYKLKNGNCNVPRSYDDRSLANFVNSQRNLYRNNELDNDKIEKLKLIEFEFNFRSNNWNNHYLELKAFFDKNGHSNYKKTDENRTLYNWTLIQRGNKKKAKLSKSKVLKLNNINFDWHPENTGSPDDDGWFDMLLQLKLYKEKFGDTNVSQVSPVYKRLGKWLNEQRLYKYGKKIRDKTYFLSKEREDLLNEIGVIWDPRENLWNLRLNLLEKHNKMYGHFIINQKDKEFGVLYTWLLKIKKNGTSKERMEKLKQVGFEVSSVKVI
ncbi:Helicase associated domain protein [Flavobacterium sp.]|uniref:Helicase associated domain protein n=1 Tax=Flavobacterium sp. TaxID=239 RepID=UPI004048E7E7